jgi:hypothetical protein
MKGRWRCTPIEKALNSHCTLPSSSSSSSSSSQLFSSNQRVIIAETNQTNTINKNTMRLHNLIAAVQCVCIYQHIWLGSTTSYLSLLGSWTSTSTTFGICLGYCAMVMAEMIYLLIYCLFTCVNKNSHLTSRTCNVNHVVCLQKIFSDRYKPVCACRAVISIQAGIEYHNPEGRIQWIRKADARPSLPYVLQCKI